VISVISVFNAIYRSISICV